MCQELDSKFNYLILIFSLKFIPTPHLKFLIYAFQVKKKMKNPIYVYYQLDKYFQNHRRYVLLSY